MYSPSLWFPIKHPLLLSDTTHRLRVNYEVDQLKGGGTTGSVIVDVYNIINKVCPGKGPAPLKIFLILQIKIKVLQEVVMSASTNNTPNSNVQVWKVT